MNSMFTLPSSMKEAMIAITEYDYAVSQATALGWKEEFETAYWYLHEFSKQTQSPSPRAQDVLRTLIIFHT